MFPRTACTVPVLNEGLIHHSATTVDATAAAIGYRRSVRMALDRTKVTYEAALTRLLASDLFDLITPVPTNPVLVYYSYALWILLHLLLCMCYSIRIRISFSVVPIIASDIP